tara:strand:+ start:342 stop:704 length:363 start_codon:yes stop_codon:yes gene_type:complete
MTYKIFHGPGVVHFIDSDSAVASGQLNQEEFTDEFQAVGRVVELDATFFPKWDREAMYMEGERVMFGDSVYRALQDNDDRDFQLPDLELDPDAEVPTPLNRSARWVEVYDSDELNEKESD